MRTVIGLCLFLLVGCNPLGQVAQSHIDGNVPEVREFDSFLKRDLSQYFAASGEAPTNIEYELLRDGPTQTGIAYPKYYAWVRVTMAGGTVQQGAVRVAAIERARFEITDFLSREEIASDAKVIERVFPEALHEKIREKLR